MKIIAHIYNDFDEKFGIPRQSGLTPIISRIVFEKQYSVKEAFRGLEGFSHLWLIWKFSKAERDEWSPTVRPPRLGGNKRVGVFATRSPFRPNSIGLSSVKLLKIDLDSPDGITLYVEGADILSGTPILDVKPYLAYTDSHPNAEGGFSLSDKNGVLRVEVTEAAQKEIPSEKYDSLISILAQDPRPQYQDEPERIYTMAFGGYDVSFRVENDTLYLTEFKKIDKSI